MSSSLVGYSEALSMAGMSTVGVIDVGCFRKETAGNGRSLLEVISKHLVQGSEENYETSESEEPVSRLASEPMFS
jgi:hypothetical protein